MHSMSVCRSQSKLLNLKSHRDRGPTVGLLFFVRLKSVALLCDRLIDGLTRSVLLAGSSNPGIDARPVTPTGGIFDDISSRLSKDNGDFSMLLNLKWCLLIIYFQREWLAHIRLHRLGMSTLWLLRCSQQDRFLWEGDGGGVFIFLYSSISSILYRNATCR